ncbi:colicin I receptor [Halochromatium salexigens]|uniref:Colicin I receptor n=2 Tax=Halochromatium salexigens TaxID=49447 RepID=A0AAJ0XG71_HALSE|nr:colicin I receptor [Halochromatium salexigens]
MTSACLSAARAEDPNTEGSVELESDVSAEIELPPVYVTTATRTREDIRTAPAPIQLIDAAEVEAAQATTLREILDLAPNLHVSPNGRTLQIRGLGQSDTLYLLDGRRLTGEFSNSFELERLSAAMIERIEIIRGPASVLYGSDALGGVVNIITKQPVEGFEVDLDVQYGANDHGEADRTMIAGSLRGGDQTFGYSLYANHLQRQPYSEQETAIVGVPKAGVLMLPSQSPNPRIRRSLPDSYQASVDYRDQARVDTLGGRLDWQVNDQIALSLDVNYVQEARENAFISTRYRSNFRQPGQGSGSGSGKGQGQQQSGSIMVGNVPARQENDNHRIDVAGTLDWSPTESLDFSYQLHYGHYDKDREILAIPYADLGYATRADSASSINKTTMTQWVNDLLAVWRPTHGQTLTAGFEHRDNAVDSTAFDADNRRFSSAFLQHQWQVLPRLNLVYGGRYDDDSVGGSNLSLQAGGVYRIAPLARLRANYAQGFKAPDDRDLYVDQVNPRGFPMLGAMVIAPEFGKTSAQDLNPEKSETIELALAGDSPTLGYQVTLFHTQVEDRIQRVRERQGLQSYNSFRNVGETHIQGVEAEGSLQLTENLGVRASATQFSTENKDSDDPLLLTPETLANLTLDVSPTPNWLLQLITTYTGEQHYASTEGIETAAGYTLVNLKASYQPQAMAGLELYAGIDNLLDEAVDTGIGSNTGPFGYLGVRYRY